MDHEIAFSPCITNDFSNQKKIFMNQEQVLFYIPVSFRGENCNFRQVMLICKFHIYTFTMFLETLNCIFNIKHEYMIYIITEHHEYCSDSKIILYQPRTSVFLCVYQLSWWKRWVWASCDIFEISQLYIQQSPTYIWLLR